jgi:DNA-binding response OmpR family regulator
MTPSAHLLSFDAATGTLRVDAREISLTGTERKLVALLMQRVNQSLTHQEIRTGVWGAGWSGGDEALRVAINRLRKKIEVNQRKPEVLTSVRGIGYRMVSATA